MKPIIFTSLFLLFIIVKINAQTKMPKNVNDEFAYSVIENYKYGNGNTRLFIMQKLREKRYSPMDIDVLVESIWTNTKNRNIILEVFHDYFGKEKEYLYANLKSLGISATSSKYLTEYIIEEKYKPTQIVNSDPKKTLQQTTKYTYPDYLINLNDFSPKISTVCQDQGYPDCLSDVSEIVKELSYARKEHLINKNSQNYLTFYKTKQAVENKRTWNTDFITINTYISENIELYEQTLQKCNYDYAIKLPQDLYQQNNLDKTEIKTSRIPDNTPSLIPSKLEETRHTSGYSLIKRDAINKPTPKYTCYQSGKVVVEVTVDREGNTIKAFVGIKGTTNISKCLLDASKEAALNTKWSKDENAPEVQIGKIVYNFNLN